MSVNLVTLGYFEHYLINILYKTCGTYLELNFRQAKSVNLLLAATIWNIIQIKFNIKIVERMWNIFFYSYLLISWRDYKHCIFEINNKF